MLARNKAFLAIALVACIPLLYACWRACVDPHDVDSVTCGASLLPTQDAVCTSPGGMVDETNDGQTSSLPFGL